MTISLSTNVARQSYAVAQGATQSAFTVSFAFFDDDDLNVFVDGTLKTLTTHYTVSGGDGSAGSVTMTSGNEVTGISGGSTVVITRDIDLDRTTDFPASGPFAVATLNTELDKITAQFADRKDVIDRSVRLQDQDEAQSMELPLKADRLGKVLGFNATTGAVEAGPTIADTQSLAAITADIGALADIEDGTIATDAISGLAAIKTNVTTVAGIASNVTSVAGNATNINTVAADGTDIGTVAGISSNVTTVAGISSDVTTVAGKATEVGRLGTADAVSDMNTLGTSSNVTNMNTLAGIASDITTTAGVASSIAASGTNASNAASSATAAASSATAAASSATAAAASQTAAAASAASAASAFDSFDDRFLGSKTSNPSVDNDGDALVTGALYFNSTANEMRVYDGANWIAATSAGNVSLILYEYTATAGQTTFSGSDDNSATLSYTVNNLQVVMNGVVLDPSDFTATSGTSVVLASGAALNDIVNIYAFKSFTTADMVSASAGGTFSANVAVTGDLTVADKIIHSGDTDTAIRFPAADNISFETGGGEKMVIDNTGVIINDDSADLDFRVEGNNSAHLIFADGGNDKVGFGASVPTQRVSIEGTANDQSSELKMTATAVASGYIGPNSNGLNIGTDTAGIVFKTGVTGGGSVGNTGTERMRLQANGRFNIHHTGDIGPAALQVRDDSEACIGLQRGGGTSGYFNYVLFANNGNTALIGSIQRVNDASVQYNTTSDARLKENIADMTGAITRVKQLAPKRYSWVNEDLDAADQDGFLAHEAQAVVPMAVSGTQDEVDDDGNPVYMQMDYSKLVPLLTGALQEAIAKIETLETKVAALEAAE